MQKIKPLILISMVVLATLLLPWEPSQESIGYWYFSNLLRNYGEFVIPARAPLYTVYLLPFSLIPYPYSENLEYLISSIFILYAFYLLLERLTNKYISILTIILWAPFIQISEPTPQKLALGIYFIGALIRLNDKENKNRILFYVLVFLACLLRDIFYGVLIIYMAYDLINFIRNKDSFILTTKNILKKKLFYFAFIPIIGFSILIQNNQSLSNFNSVGFSTSTWFPGDAKKMSSTALLQAFNWRYIEIKYGTFIDHDFYQTNKEGFNGANTLIQLFENNPKMSLRIIFENIRWFSIHFFSQVSFINYVPLKFIIFPIIMIFIFYGAFKNFQNNYEYKLLIFSCAAISLVSILNIPKPRYMLSLIPIYIMGISYFSNYVTIRFSKNKYFFNGLFSLIFIVFSWGNILKWFEINPMHATLDNILSSNSNSLKKSSKQLNQLGVDCVGAMSLEALHLKTNLPAFKNINIYDVWEIPPFGSYSDKTYSGLNPERVNCLFVSRNLATGVGAGTNYKIRYDNYILPYENYLIDRGAIKTEINGYGYSIVLRIK